MNQEWALFWGSFFYTDFHSQKSYFSDVEAGTIFYHLFYYLKNKKLSLLAAVTWLITVTILLCLPGNEFPKITWLNKIWFDKWVHAGLFLVLVVVWSWAYTGRINPVKLKILFLKIMLLSAGYGAFMELMQFRFIPFRSFDIGDIVADGLGSWAGYFFSVRKFLTSGMK